MNQFHYLFFMYNYLKGVVKFRTKDYKSAKLFFEKADKYDPKGGNKLLYQYYGQTLLCLKKTDEAFSFLSKAYKLYIEKGWDVTNQEEYILTKDTLDALKYLSDNFDLTVDGFNYEQEIRINS